MCVSLVLSLVFFFFKQKTAYEMRISDWSSDVCSSDLAEVGAEQLGHATRAHPHDGTVGQLSRGDGGAVLQRGAEQLGEASHGQVDDLGADRTSVVVGKSVSVRVDPGGRRTLKKKDTTTILGQRQNKYSITTKET